MSYAVKELREYMKNNPPIPNNYSGNCFGCVNPSGLNLKFWQIDGTLFTSYIIPTKFSGFQGLGHGGIIATLLDEISAWTISVNLKELAITQDFSLKYIKPVYINQEIIVEGKIASNEGNHILIHAHIKDLNDRILVESTSTWSMLGRKALAKVFNTNLEEVEKVYKNFFKPIERYLKKRNSN